MFSSSSGKFERPLTRTFNTNQKFKKKVRVASYKDPYQQYYRRGFRLLIAFVLPIIAIILIILLVNYYISTNFAPTPTLQETYIYDSVPVAAGSIPAPFDATSSDTTASNIENIWLPAYDNLQPSSQAFLIPGPAQNQIDWIMTFYHQRLTANNQWQLYQQNSLKSNVDILPSKLGDPVTIKNETTQEQQLYVQGLKQYPDHSVIASLFINARLVTASDLHKAPGLYGPGAKDGQLYVTFTKMYNRQKR